MLANDIAVSKADISHQSLFYKEYLFQLHQPFQQFTMHLVQLPFQQYAVLCT